jgi:hypothetical protein
LNYYILKSWQVSTKLPSSGTSPKDPEVRSISADKKVAEVSIPINDNYTIAAGNKLKERPGTGLPSGTRKPT